MALTNSYSLTNLKNFKTILHEAESNYGNFDLKKKI